VLVTRIIWYREAGNSKLSIVPKYRKNWLGIFRWICSSDCNFAHRTIDHPIRQPLIKPSVGLRNSNYSRLYTQNTNIIWTFVKFRRAPMSMLSLMRKIRTITMDQAHRYISDFDDFDLREAIWFFHGMLFVSAWMPDTSPLFQQVAETLCSKKCWLVGELSLRSFIGLG